MAKLMYHEGDTKAGTLIGRDGYGNKFYENLEEELPRRSQEVSIEVRNPG